MTVQTLPSAEPAEPPSTAPSPFSAAEQSRFQKLNLLEARAQSGAPVSKPRASWA